MSAITIKVRDRDPSYEKNGQLFFPSDGDLWRDGPEWLEVGGCQHAETMCRHCWQSWLSDHEILLSVDGYTFNLDDVTPEFLADG